MFSSKWSSFRVVVGAMTIFGLLSRVSADTVEYCSDINTADTGKNTSIYQSHGLCTGFCNQNYAFAIVQYDGCWCSNYAPDSSASGSCDTDCPGYGFEACGGDELYGYIALMRKPSGTQGAGDSSATSAQVSTVTETRDTVTSTVILPPSTSSSSLETLATSTTSSTWVPTPVTTLETVTGQVRTVTLMPTVPPNSQNVNELSRQDGGGGGGLGTGGAVGLTIGLVALVAIVCGKQHQAGKYNNVWRECVTGLGGPVPSRTMSKNSRYVLGTDGRQVVETWENDNRETPSSRRSRLIPVDPRLDPFAPIYQRGENKSRESVNTLRDDHDYSRRVHGQGPILRATNPNE
ncbi:hypothetical protein BKA61DRAFT_497467 [Leptodontidium sp. MPI-SDFR-AT-0119]|nr:hypothetical protein BKA61DRAFT_497467 [Leptodontidium sp. MPI-SDFR-AT-0119]